MSLFARIRITFVVMTAMAATYAEFVYLLKSCPPPMNPLPAEIDFFETRLALISTMFMTLEGALIAAFTGWMTVKESEEDRRLAAGLGVLIAVVVVAASGPNRLMNAFTWAFLIYSGRIAAGIVKVLRR